MRQEKGKEGKKREGKRIRNKKRREDGEKKIPKTG